MKTILITGGSGFIGSNTIRFLSGFGYKIINVDSNTYAGDSNANAGIVNCQDYHFDINDKKAINGLFSFTRPDLVMHLAAETHVDNSIKDPEIFVKTNVNGTMTLLEEARRYWLSLPEKEKEAFRFLHISTDEVYGHLGHDGEFTEKTPYNPSSPYSASKAASDHLVRAWYRTFGLPTLITNCSNNYGPRQCPEKLIPLIVTRALRGEPLPVYGDGTNVRDWLYVEDHASALHAVISRGKVGETYLVGGRCEIKNIDLVNMICQHLSSMFKKDYSKQIVFVNDRPGHDFRYAIDPSKLENDLGWKPSTDFESGIKKTIEWYADNTSWCDMMIKKTKDHFNAK
jgi:dTDP-glucose 4,6-dehydratase